MWGYNSDNVYINTMKPKEFYQRWREGIRNLTPQQQLYAKMQGHLWAVIGLILGLVVLLYRRIWYFSIFLLALIWLQAWEYLGTKQRYEATKQIMESIENPKKENNIFGVIFDKVLK